MQNPQRTRDPYQRISAYYDLLEWFVKTGRRAVTRSVSAAGCGRVLDVCCGTGTQVVALRAAGVFAVGVDLSRHMLRHARAKTNAEAFFVRADAARLPFPEACFDGIVFSFALHEKPPAERTTVLVEARRVLKPGGILFVFDYAAPSSSGLSFFRSAIAAIERLAGLPHYRAFRDYLNRGGTEGALRSHGVRMLSRKLFFQGTVGLYEGCWEN